MEVKNAFNFPAPENHKRSTELIEGRNIITNFGSVETSKQRTKIVSYCRPKTKNQISYRIERDPKLKLVRENFELDHWQGKLNPDEDFRLAVTYNPTLPSLNDVEIFNYVDSDFEIIKITVKGKALGPHCTMSSKKLVLYKTPTETILEGKIEIMNDSEATAYFKIDCVAADIFRIKPLEGTVKPNDYQHISVKFCPEKQGLFVRKLFCLVWNSEPLVCDILGYHDDVFQDINRNLKYYNFPLDQTYGFGAYMNDSLSVRRDVPPFSLSSNYLDFGCVPANEKGPRTQVTSLTNHMRKAILVQWQKGTGTFKIAPETMKIPSNTSAQFEVEFNPEENYNIYSETLLAQILWKTERASYCDRPRQIAPLICTLKTQGHSFPENEGWIAHIEAIPEVVYWQPCLPGQTVCTTFLLQNKTHLPVMYKLIPPNKTNVTANPMIGKFRNFEIIVAQLQTEKIKIKTYIEEWKIRINGREDKHITVYFHGETSVPSIEIGTKNNINGGPVQEDTKKTIEVVMKNTSFFDISYKFRLKEKTILSIVPLEDILKGNEQTKIQIIITGSLCAPNMEKFICEMNVIERNGAISGEMYETEVEIFSECSYSQLCAVPSEENLENVSFGRKINTEFEASNFGESSIFFQTCHCGDDVDDINFRIKPCFGEVHPKSTKRFSVIGIVSKIGQHTHQFGYYNRMVKDSPMVTGNPISIFALSYCAEFPTIQVEEIVEHNFGPLFGKNHFYKEYLQIPRFNKALREIVQDQTREIHFRLPDCEVQDKVFTLTLALVNITQYETSVELKRKKICDCELKEIAETGFTKRKKGFDCPHRQTLVMELQDTKFYSKSCRLLTINIIYCLPNDNQMCYTMELSNRRTIKIYFHFFSIPLETPKISIYTETFKMNLQTIFIGTRIAPVQLLWMYNNTRNLLNVEFDTTEIECMCSIEGFKVLEIINPIEQILPYSSLALLVKFHPIEVKKYNVEVNVTYRNPRETSYSLIFELEGSGNMEILKESTVEQMTRVSKYCGKWPVSFSTECIDATPLPVWNKRKELIFIKNNFKNKIVQYIWGRVKLENIIEVYTEKNYSLLAPKEVQPVVIIIQSFSQPSIANLLLPCEVVSYTDLVLHQITKGKHNEAQNLIDNEESGESKKQKNPIKIHPKPETVYATLILNITTVHSKDLDANMEPVNQFKQYPNQSMENIPKRLLKNFYSEEQRFLKFRYPDKEIVRPAIGWYENLIFCKILEEVISDVIFSKGFKEYLKISSEAPPNNYTDFVMNDRQIMSKKRDRTPLSNEDIEYYRKREIENFFAQPKVTELSKIFQKLIYESVLKVIRCHSADLNIKEVNEQIESTLYTCKKRTCICSKNDNKDEDA